MKGTAHHWRVARCDVAAWPVSSITCAVPAGTGARYGFYVSDSQQVPGAAACPRVGLHLTEPSTRQSSARSDDSLSYPQPTLTDNSIAHTPTGTNQSVITGSSSEGENVYMTARFVGNVVSAARQPLPVGGM
jgi:hypothetical protein